MDVLSLSKTTAPQNRLDQKIATRLKNDFAGLKAKVNKFRQHLTREKCTILERLSSYQSYATSSDEFLRIFECLDSIDEIRDYLLRKTSSVAVFSPLNMPIYALVLYAIMPALVADSVHVRAPERMTELMQRLEPLLRLDEFFPNIHIAYTSREAFVQKHVTTADVIIFTGKSINAQHVIRRCRKDSLFLFNGWGCNPIVVGEAADLDVATRKTVQARLFSSGQDCAGPDQILVSRQDAPEFISKLKCLLNDMPIGSYRDPATIVGPLADEAQIRLISNILLKSADKIVYGGRIDYNSKTIHPTIICGDLSTSMNFEELFAPVVFVSIYDDVAQLARYFEHPSYVANEMYVSLFGTCAYVESLQKSILVKDNVIFDIDRGNEEFGGYSMGASFVSSDRKIVPRPILVPREIHDFLEPGSSGYKLSTSLQAKIGKQIRSCMLETFGSNLAFGFVFGSVARQQATGNSDINTMAVLTEIDNAQVDEYVLWLRHLHVRHQLEFKESLSAIVLTVAELENLCNQIDSRKLSEGFAEASISVEALSGHQCGVGGDKKLSVEYGRRMMPYSQVVRRKRTTGLVRAPRDQQHALRSLDPFREKVASQFEPSSPPGTSE